MDMMTPPVPQQPAAPRRWERGTEEALCFPLELQPVTRYSVAATILFCILSAAAMAPQYAKIFLRQSSEGVSFWALALATLGYSLQMDNLFVLHFDQIKECFCIDQCRVEPIIACDHSLTTFAYIAVAFFTSLPLMPVAASMHPDKHTRDGAMLGFTILCVGMIIAKLPLVWLLLPGGSCSELAGYGVFLGISAGVCYAVMYIPQGVESYRLRGAMALSYFSIGLHIILGVGAAVQKVKGTKERAVTWVPPLVANAFQVVLLSMNLYFDLVERRAGGSAEAKGVKGGVAGGKGAKTFGATDQAGGKSTADGLEAGGSSGDDGKKGREAPPEPACCSVDWYKKYL